MTFSSIRIIVLLALLFQPFARAEDSFSKGNTVVIMSGLPGDMESERSYAEQTLQLLRLLDNPAMAPKKVILLTSSLQPPEIKPSYPFEVLTNKRESFLGLSDKLKGEANPVFIVFGHGGNQGPTAVFHIPGPRLTADDFVTVAKESPASTWMLFFPGSGIFAKALQAPKRTILATEADDKHFLTDPIAFPLFLEALKTETGMMSLAEKTGSATDQWYQQRNLARTEEPALWVDLQEPRKLIDLNATTTTTTGTATITITSTPNATNVAPVSVQVVPTNIAPDASWNGIQPVAATAYPNADAVTLSRHVAFVLSDDGPLTEDDEVFLQILTRDGKKYGDFDFSFTPPEEDLRFLACEVRQPDNTVERLEPDEIRDAGTNEPEGYGEVKRKIFSLPHIQPGSIVHLHFQRAWKNFPQPHVFEDIPLVSDVPTVALKIEVSVPDNTSFHYRILNQPPVDPTVTKTEYGSVYNWQFHNLPSMVEEPLQPRESVPSLVVTTCPDWASFSNWYIRLIRASNTPSPELTAEAIALVANAKTDREKIEAVTQFVTHFRYVSVPLGVNSFRPHAAANVFENRYGDCKDKANLLNTMLTSIGFKTHLVLVPRFSQAYDDIPGFAFNHAISAVELDNKILWIDSTDDVCRFGLLPPGDPGRKVLVIDDHVDKLTQLPEPVATDHRMEIKTEIDVPDSASRAAETQISADTQGYADYLLRATAKSTNTHADIVPLLERAFYPTTGSFEPTKQQSTIVADLDQNFSWKADGMWQGLISQLPQSKLRLVRLPGWLPHEWLAATLPRTTGLHLNEGYPIEISQNTKFTFPAHSSGIALPAGAEDKSKVLTWKLDWVQTGPTEVQANLDVVLLKADLTVEEAGEFQRSCHHLVEALQDGLSFQSP